MTPDTTEARRKAAEWAAYAAYESPAGERVYAVMLLAEAAALVRALCDALEHERELVSADQYANRYWRGIRDENKTLRARLDATGSDKCNVRLAQASTARDCRHGLRTCDDCCWIGGFPEESAW